MLCMFKVLQLYHDRKLRLDTSAFIFAVFTPIVLADIFPALPNYIHACVVV